MSLVYYLFSHVYTSFCMSRDMGALECCHLAIPVERIEVELRSSSYRSAPETGNAAFWARSTRRTATKAWKKHTVLQTLFCLELPLIRFDLKLSWGEMSTRNQYTDTTSQNTHHSYCDLFTLMLMVDGFGVGWQICQDLKLLQLFNNNLYVLYIL